MRSSIDIPSAGSLRVGARILNARGTLGTLGCFARTLDDRRPVLLTSEHVLFGAGAGASEPVWLGDAGSKRRAGRTRHGRRGLVRHGDRDVHVDCATADLDPEIADGVSFGPEAAGQRVELEQPVHILGATTGAVRGVVSDTNYHGVARIAGRDFRTSGQILVRPERAGATLNSHGDSGAALRTADGAVVGLVWGATPSGEALACPIAPVLWVLHVELVQPLAPGANR